MTRYFEALYQFTPDTRLGVEELNTRFKSVDSRLLAIEEMAAGLDAITADLRLVGVARLTTELQALLPAILEDANDGYLSNLGNGSIPWVKVDRTGATPEDIGAASAATINAHINGTAAHSIPQVSGLATALGAKQDFSALLQAIATELPIDGGLIVGTGSTLQIEELVAGAGINFVRDPELGTWTINALNADGEVQGEANTASNLGDGVGLFAGKSGIDLHFRSLVSQSAAVAFSQTAGELRLSLDASLLAVPIASVVNLPAELSARQGASSNLTALSGLSLTAGKLLRSTAGGLEQIDLTAGSNITLTPGAGGIEIASSAAGESNTASNLGAGAGLFVEKSGVDLRFRSLASLASFLTIDLTATLARFDFSVSGLLSAIANNAIAWGKVSKSGAVAADVGAEPVGAVATHAAGSGVHAIAGVTGLSTALDGRLERVKGSTQEMSTSLAIQPTTANVGSYTPNAAGQNYWVLTQTSSTTINNPTNLTSGRVQFLDFTLIQDSTGGRSTTWGNNYTWGDGGAPSLKTSPNAINILTFKSWGGKLYFMGHRAY